jgi:hypothetical protein
MILGAGLVGVAAPFLGGGMAPAHAMTCAADPPLDYGCKVVFFVVGSVCTGQGTPPGAPPLIGLNTAARPDLCPPLG